MSLPRYKRWKRAARASVLRFLVRLLMLMPFRVAFAIGAALGRVAWPLAPALRRQMRASLAVAFPELPPEERDAIARESLVNLGKTAGEGISIRSWAHRMEEYVEATPETLATLERAKARGRGVIWVMAHIGNWELVRRFAHLTQPSAAIAKRTWHPKLDELMVQFRAEGGVQTLFREDPSTSRSMLRVLRQGGGLGILIDQDTNVQNVFVPFFGRLAATPRAAADFGLRFGAAMLVVTSHRKGPRASDGHRMEIVEVPYDAEAPDREAEAVRLTAACVAVQEAAIRRHPAEWVWMHQRWKTRPAAEQAAPALEHEQVR